MLLGHFWKAYDQRLEPKGEKKRKWNKESALSGENIIEFDNEIEKDQFSMRFNIKPMIHQTKVIQVNFTDLDCHW